MVSRPGRRIGLPTFATLAALLAGPAAASSDEAWTEFRGEVETRCLEAAGETLDDPAARVDPFGSERFGLALLTGRERGGDETREIVCVFDKATRAVELGGPLPAEDGSEASASSAAPPVSPAADASAAPAIATPAATQAEPEAGDLADPFGERCAEECEASLAALSDSDRAAIIDLPARIARTLAAIDLPDADGGMREAIGVARAVGGGEASAALEAPLDVGGVEASCTLRWFGFLDEAARAVGTHRCRIEAAADGTLAIEKLTGEGMLVRLVPLTDQLSLAVGRSFLPDQPERDYDLERPVNAGNPNFGNVVGLATRSGGQIHILRGAELGMAPADPDFFSVLTISGS